MIDYQIINSLMRARMWIVNSFSLKEAAQKVWLPSEQGRDESFFFHKITTWTKKMYSLKPGSNRQPLADFWSTRCIRKPMRFAIVSIGVEVWIWGKSDVYVPTIAPSRHCNEHSSKFYDYIRFAKSRHSLKWARNVLSSLASGFKLF